MSFYRIIWVGDQTHISGRVLEIDCPDDDAAIERAREASGGDPVEVWNQGRMIASLGPATQAAQTGPGEDGVRVEAARLQER